MVYKKKPHLSDVAFMFLSNCVMGALSLMALAAKNL